MIHLLIADAKNRLQYAENWGWIMIKEKTVTGIQVTQSTVPERIKVVTGWIGQGGVEDLLSLSVHSDNLSQDNVLKLKLAVCDQPHKD